MRKRYDVCDDIKEQNGNSQSDMKKRRLFDQVVTTLFEKPPKYNAVAIRMLVISPD